MLRAIRDKREFPGFLWAATICAAALLAASAAWAAGGPPQTTFKTPELAAKALADACRADDLKALDAMLGPDGKDLVSSGDELLDKTSRQDYAKACDEMMKVLKSGPSAMVVQVGKENWPMPIPIVRDGKSWRFDTAAGKEEILNRRIGDDELSAIQVCKAYVEAQHEYHAADRDADDVLEYAQRIASTPGQQDGLFWSQAEGEEQSPMGPLAAQAAQEGYKPKTAAGEPAPYHGYYYRVLTGQGANAPGGEYSYVINGNMVAGFALLAWPAQYGSTGIMTFQVGPSGVIYEKDLGEKTADVAQAVTKFDPDKTWKKAK